MDTELLVASVFPVLTDIKNVEETLCCLVESVKAKRKMLERVTTNLLKEQHLSKGTTSTAPTSVAHPNSKEETVALSRVVLSACNEEKGRASKSDTNLESPDPPEKAVSVVKALETCVVKFKRKIHASLDQIMSQYYRMDLAPLYASRVGEVIRSFQPIDIQLLSEALEKFTEEGGKEKLAYLLHVGAPVNERLAPFSSTPLGTSLSLGMVEACRMLLQAGAVPDSNVLTSAIHCRNLEAVQLLVEAGADMEAKMVQSYLQPSMQNTPIFVAINQGEREIAKYLASNGANLSATDHVGQHPLDYAVFLGQKDVVEVLLSKGANVHAVTSPSALGKTDELVDGFTALHHAAVGGHRETVTLLLAQDGVEVNRRARNGRTPLHCTVLPSSRRGTPSDNAEIADILLSKGADLHARNEDGNTILHLAADRMAPQVALLALDRGIDVNATNNAGETALHRVCRGARGVRMANEPPEETRIKIAKLLIERGVDPHASNNADDTAWSLLQAVRRIHPLRKFMAEVMGAEDAAAEEEEEGEEEEGGNEGFGGGVFGDGFIEGAAFGGLVPPQVLLGNGEGGGFEIPMPDNFPKEDEADSD